MWDVLLMTAAIAVDKKMLYHLHISEDERLRQYLDTLIFYITKSNFSDIVFVDWSWYKVNDLNYLVKLAKIYNKNLEILWFTNDWDKVVSKWKWYWENKIIEYAIKNSKLIDNHDTFFKVTWRYTVKNINEIVLNEKNRDNCFFKWYYWKFYCNTAFFKVSKIFFQKYLFWIWELVNDKEWIYLEHIYYDVLKKERKQISCFKVLPIMHWVSWWSWKKLDQNPIVLLIIKILSKFWFFKI